MWRRGKEDNDGTEEVEEGRRRRIIQEEENGVQEIVIRRTITHKYRHITHTRMLPNPNASGAQMS